MLRKILTTEPNDDQLRQAIFGHGQICIPSLEDAEALESDRLRAAIQTVEAFNATAILSRSAKMDRQRRWSIDEPSLAALHEEIEQIRDGSARHSIAWLAGWLLQDNDQEQRSGASEDDAQLLALALNEVAALENELSDLKRDNHQALAKSARHPSAGPLASIDDKAIPATLLRKIIREPKRLTPVDVLTIMSGVARERMKVLPSAWKSAQESERFEYSERLIELIDRLVFDYRDAIGSGRPDAEARNILGSAYSAKESHTVSLAPTKGRCVVDAMQVRLRT